MNRFKKNRLKRGKSQSWWVRSKIKRTEQKELAVFACIDQLQWRNRHSFEGRFWWRIKEENKEPFQVAVRPDSSRNKHAEQIDVERFHRSSVRSREIGQRANSQVTGTHAFLSFTWDDYCWYVLVYLWLVQGSNYSRMTLFDCRCRSSLQAVRLWDYECYWFEQKELC